MEMAYYPRIRRWRDTATRKRTVDRLVALRSRLKQEIPRRTTIETLLLATWNLREFGRPRPKFGPRLPESLYYIAEIISHFDLIAVQEVDRDLGPLEDVVRLMGPQWDYIATNVTAGTSGSGERMAFVFDKGKVRFENLVGELVLPKAKLLEGGRQFARTPFFVKLQVGWLNFNLCTVHIYYGSESGKKLERRVEEIQKVGKFVSDGIKKEPGNFILLGDFNIVSPDHETRKALVDQGFVIPEPLQQIPTNQYGNRFYDQIAFRVAPDELQLGDSKPNAGSFDVFETVFRDDDWRTYYDLLGKDRPPSWDKDGDGKVLDDAAKKDFFTRTWRTFQMSDHYPMWVELKVDFADAYLEKLAQL